MGPKIQNIPFKLAVGESLQLSGGFWDWLSVAKLSAGAALVARGGNIDVPLIVGRRVSLGVPMTQVVSLENVGSVPVSGELVVGSGDVRDSTVVGTVSVTNDDKARTEAGIAYLRGVGSGPTALEYSGVALVNPSGSGLNAFVNRVVFSATAAAWLHLSIVEDAATMLAALSSATDLGGARNKKIGAGLSSSAVYSMSATAIADYGSKGISKVRFSTEGTMDYLFSEPILVPENAALIVHEIAVNQELHGNFEFFEEAI